jgi:hypothetical protein
MKIIYLTQDRKSLIDDEDYERINKVKWHAVNVGGYFYARSKKVGYMHRYILNINGKKDIDHKNHNTLDNQKANLRICSRQENLRNKLIGKLNKSGYKNIYWDKFKNKWVVQLRIKDKKIVRYFISIEDAINEKVKLTKTIYKDYYCFG